MKLTKPQRAVLHALFEAGGDWVQFGTSGPVASRLCDRGLCDGACGRDGRDEYRINHAGRAAVEAEPYQRRAIVRTWLVRPTNQLPHFRTRHFMLVCGHEAFRPASRGIPKRGTIGCIECTTIAVHDAGSWCKGTTDCSCEQNREACRKVGWPVKALPAPVPAPPREPGWWSATVARHVDADRAAGVPWQCACGTCRAARDDGHVPP